MNETMQIIKELSNVLEIHININKRLKILYDAINYDLNINADNNTQIIFNRSQFNKNMIEFNTLT